MFNRYQHQRHELLLTGNEVNCPLHQQQRISALSEKNFHRDILIQLRKIFYTASFT